MAAIEAVGHAAEQLEKHYALGRSAEVLDMRQRAWASVTMHVHWLALHREDA